MAYGTTGYASRELCRRRIQRRYRRNLKFLQIAGGFGVMALIDGLLFALAML